MHPKGHEAFREVPEFRQRKYPLGTAYSTLAKGPRYLELAEGYITRLALDANNEIIGYEYLSLGKFTDFLKKGINADEAIKKSMGSYGRFADAVKYIDPREE